MKPRLTIRTKLLFSLLLILLASYSTLVYTTVRGVDKSLEEKISKDLESALKYAQSQYLDRPNHIKYHLLQPTADAAFQADLRESNLDRLRETVRRWQRLIPYVDILTVTSPDGRVLARLGASREQNRLEFTDVRAAVSRQRETVIATELVSYEILRREGVPEVIQRFSGQGEALVVTVAMPVVAGDGRLLGMVVAGDILNQDPHIPYQVQEILGKEVEVTITQRGLTIASSLSEDAFHPASIAPAILARLEQKRPYRGDAEIGEHVYKTAFEPLANVRGEFVGSLSVALSKRDFRHIRMENLLNILASAGIGILLSFCIAFIAARRLTKPLVHLAEGAHRIELGELYERVLVEGDDEFGKLAGSFNRMAESLEERDRTIRNKTLALEELNESLEKKVAARTAELQMEKGRLEAILTSMAEGIVVTDRDNRVIVFNPAAQRIFEQVPFWIIDKPFIEVCENIGFCPLVQEIDRLRSSSGAAEVKEVDVTVKGKHLKVKLSPLLDEARAFAGVVMSIRDVTVEEAVDRMKTEFISMVSHELKTPLTSIKGSLQYIMTRGEGLTETARELLAICQRNTDRLMRLISDLLDISRIESGRMAFSFKPESIHDLVAYAVEEIMSFAHAHQITVENDVSSGLPPVYADHDRLIQVITNLLSNAVKFSPAGETVQITAAREGNYLAVSVEDRGNAILPAEREKLFRKFQKLNGSGADDRGGTGLGLAISREIIEHHRGKISYSAGRDEVGNIFTFTVPVYEEDH